MNSFEFLISYRTRTVVIEGKANVVGDYDGPSKPEAMVRAVLAKAANESKQDDRYTLDEIVAGFEIGGGVLKISLIQKAPEGCCEVCGLPMKSQESMFKFHGYSESCEQAKARLEAENYKV